jgi:hypothetical protein
MADSIANMLVQSVGQSVDKGPDISGALTKGAQLAQTAQNIQNQRQQMEQQKQEIFMKKIEKVGGLYEIYGKAEGKAQKVGYDVVIPNTVKALGMEDYFPQTTQAILSSSPHAVPYLIGEVRKDPAKLQSTLVALQDKSGESLGKLFPEIQKFGALSEIVSTVGDETKQLVEANKVGIGEEGRDYRAKLAADAALAKQKQGQEAAPEVEQAKKISDLFVAYKASGGQAGTQSRIGKLKEVRQLLEDNKVQFGTLGKSIPYGANLDVLARIDPKAKAAIDTVRSSINVKMRTGDPNPTENQINQIYNQAIDPRLSNTDNIAMLDKEIAAEEAADQNAQKMFIDAGKMKAKGGGGKIPADKKAAFKKMKPESQKKALEGLSKILNMSMDDVRKELGVK